MFSTKPTLTFVSLVCTVVLFSCKVARPAESVTQSLDWVTGMGERVACDGGNPVLAKPEQLLLPSDLKGDLVRELSAIPTPLQEDFFGKMHGRLVFQPQIPCAKGALACWRPEGDNGISIFVKLESTPAKSRQTMREAVVTEFATVLVEVVLKLKDGQDGTELQPSNDLFQMQGDFAVALLGVVANNPRMSLRQFERDLPKELLDKSVSRKVRLQTWAKIAASPGAKRFAVAAFAQTFDSWNCSALTRANLEKFFKGSNGNKGPYELMSDFAQGLEETFGKKTVAKRAESDDTSPRGFGLYGRWGSGNGPVRQAFSNWADWRSEGRGLMNFRRFADGGGLVFRRNWFNPFRWDNENPYVTSSYSSDGGAVYSGGSSYASYPNTYSSGAVAGYTTVPTATYASGYSYSDPGYSFYDGEFAYVYQP